ncbi:MAG: hypothetical protein IPN89_13720 [Saprospiraceae bacterium]|nr:hypothetical protein [Saprospiraceae bacterium]
MKGIQSHLSKLITVIAVVLCVARSEAQTITVLPGQVFSSTVSGGNTISPYTVTYVFVCNNTVQSSNSTGTFTAPSVPQDCHVYAVNHDNSWASPANGSVWSYPATNQCATVIERIVQVLECIEVCAGGTFTQKVLNANTTAPYLVTYVLICDNVLAGQNTTGTFTLPAAATSCKYFAVNHDGSTISASGTANGINVVGGTCHSLIERCITIVPPIVACQGGSVTNTVSFANTAAPYVLQYVLVCDNSIVGSTSNPATNPLNVPLNATSCIYYAVNSQGPVSLTAGIGNQLNVTGTSCYSLLARCMTVVPVPVITVANSCAGGSTATFTQTGGPSGGTWTVSGGGTIGATTGVFTPTTAGCFTATYTTPTGNCSDTKSFVVFPAAPAAPVVSNTCNTAITVPALTAVTGFTAQYSFDNGSTWGTSPVSPTTPGCYTIKTRYVTNACGTILAGTVAPAACAESVASNAVIFPAAPAAPVVSNTCNTAITVPVLAAVTGFTAQYSFDDGTSWGTSNVSPTTPGCYTIRTRYVTTGCGTIPANTVAPVACAQSVASNAVIFPTAPSAPVVSNTCNTAITVPALTAVTGFTAQYSFDNGSTWGTSPVSPTTPGCYTIKTRYVANACGTILAGTVAPAACAESVASNAVIFPAAPAAPVVSNTCNTAITVPALTAVTGFTAQYSFDNGSTWGTSPVSPTTLGCYTIKTRYVTNACGTILAGTVAPAACSESVASNAVIFPAAPAAPVLGTNTCNTAIVVPTVPSVPGFTAQYSFNNGSTWGTSATSSTTPGCYTIKTRYVTAATCGTIIAGTTAPAACAESVASNAVIFLRLL